MSQAAPRVVALRDAVPICGRCGVIAPREQQRCELCEQPLPAKRAAAPIGPGPLFWVAVRCRFQCRSCGFLSPLDALDLDGSVECAQCGLRQHFHVPSWTEALGFAHAVGDLAFPPPEGRHPHPAVWIGEDNPHAEVGLRQAFAEHRQSGTEVAQGVTVTRSLLMEAAPGHPVCLQCAKPLELRQDQAGRAIHSHCPECDEQASYALPQGATKLYSPLGAVVGAEHRTDKPRARLETTAGGPTALKCPNCGAALPAGRDRLIACSFCKTASWIPAQAVVRESGETPEPTVFWLGFVGPSPRRIELQQGAAWQPPPAPILKKGGKLGKLGAAAHGPLEQAPKRPGVHGAQLALSLLLPLLALGLAFAVTLLFRLL